MLRLVAKAAVGWLVCALFTTTLSSAMPPKYQATDKGLALEGVSARCPMIYDNDWWSDVPDAAYLWAKASLGQCDLRGNIITRCTFGWEKGYAHKLEEQVRDCQKLLKAARDSGLRNIPEPVLGAAEALRRPNSGRIEDTKFTRSKGSDLLVAEARRASKDRPLLVFVGGSCTTVATAYLTDPTIAERTIVFQIDGGGYNGSDGWAWQITMKRCRFANWAKGYFWEQVSKWKPDRFQTLPKNPLGDLLRAYAKSDLGKANQWGDGAWIYYVFDSRCLTKAEDYDRSAITVPRDGTSVKRMEDEFFVTMTAREVYQKTRQEGNPRDSAPSSGTSNTGRDNETPDPVNNVKPPPGVYRTSWIGNSFAGNGGPNGFGYWVQNGADEIEVTPDGTVFAGMTWDEAGRCAGLYKDGKVNRVLLQAPERNKLSDSAWGWGTGNNAVASSGENLFIANSGKKLLHFTWKPGDLNSARFAEAVDLDAEAVGLNARGDHLVVVYCDALEWRHGSDLKATGRFHIRQARDAAIAADGSLWILADNTVRHYDASGKDLGVRLPGLDQPSALAFDAKADQLIVCDNGRCQQVLFFDVKDEPKRTATFGEEGGLRAGTPGLAESKKLFGLRGAGTDAAGNLYVAMGFDNGPNGNLVLRSFEPSGKLRWEATSLAFVDTFGFDPDADGSVVYSRTAVFDLDLSQRKAGREWRLRGFTIDYPTRPDTNRIKHGCSVVVRNLQGRRLLFTIGQYAGGYRLHTFGDPNGLVAHEVDRIEGKDQWAWHVAENGDIWHGDAPQRTIRRYSFKGWKSDGKPEYDWNKPQSWPWPEDFKLVRRIIYHRATDSLYLFGYLKGQKIDSWGVVGWTARRYDGWLAGKKIVAWTKRDLPTNPKGSDEGKPLTPNSVDLAGDYLFVGMVKPESGNQYTHIFRTSDAGYVGSLAPGDEVGGNAGWQDMPYAVQALQRKNGEYLILVEEDWRGKNLLYRWQPKGDQR